MTTPLRCLLVEDSEDDALLVLRHLREGGFDVTSERVDTPETMCAALGRQPWDIVISDYRMPRFDGAAALQLVQASGMEVPFIIVSGTIGEDTAVAVMKLGATDYLLKDRLARLGSAVTHALAASRLRRERLLAEESLSVAHAQLGQLLEHSPAVLYALKLNGDKIIPHFVSGNVTTLLGFTVGEVSSHEWWLGQLHPDDRERAVNSRSEAFKAGASRIEYRLRHKDGHYCWVDDSRQVIRDAAGASVELSGVWTDITERKRAEEIVGQASGQVTRDRRKQVGVELAILVTATAMVFALAARFNWFEAVTQWVLANELKQLDETILATIFLVAGLVMFGFRRWRESESELTSRQQTQAALGLLHNELDRRIKQRTAELDKANRALHAENDERRRAEKKIREQASLLDKAQDAIFVTDLEHRIQYWNKSAERLYGWSAEEAIGRPATDLILKDRAALERVQQELRQHGEWIGEMNHIARDGRTVQVEARGTIVSDEQDQPKAILTINTDITERKKIEAQFLRAQRVESIGTLAGGIAHDLNNILAPILMSIGLLRTTARDATEERILNTVEMSAKRGADMVRQVLSFARGIEGHQMPTPPRHLIGDVMSIIEETFPKLIRSESNVARDVWPIMGDPTQLHQVLLNLCVNARDAMPNGGTLTISAENVLIDEHYVKMNQQGRSGQHVVIKVTDTGTGIPPVIRDRIFDPFFTTKEMGKGTGLGLATVMTIVRSHGGFINVYSEVGNGTTFKVHFPAETAAIVSGRPATPVVELPRGNGEWVLVVDDEASVRTITKQTLEAFGYRVLLASNGVEAISTYVEHKRDIAVVLTDMMMPIMDGPTTIAALMNLNPHVRIIAASGLDANGSVAKVTGAGVRHFLPKPYTAETMLKAMHGILSEPPPGSIQPDTLNLQT
jgi:PAS domain S-box-containing protein